MFFAPCWPQKTKSSIARAYPWVMFAARASLFGLCGALPEHNLGAARADLYYPYLGLAVEVDTGTQSKQQLLKKPIVIGA